jgi:phospholipase C
LLTADEISLINKAPHSSPYMPKQEKGIKPSCALPYQLYADGKLSADKQSFGVKFTASDKFFGSAAIGSPFNVYAPGKYLNEDVRTWAYTAKAGDSLTDEWPLSGFENSHYHLRVYGPNGFFREFKGNANDPDLDIVCEYQHSLTDGKKLTSNIQLALHNLGSKQHSVQVIDHAYKTNNHIAAVKPSGTSNLVLNLVNSHGWYDFSIKVSGSASFEKRYAGRVETGKPGFSDPQMGNV